MRTMFKDFQEYVNEKGYTLDEVMEDDELYDEMRYAYSDYLDQEAERHGAYDLATGRRCKA